MCLGRTRLRRLRPAEWQDAGDAIEEPYRARTKTPPWGGFVPS
jgi:hypothetical protein